MKLFALLSAGAVLLTSLVQEAAAVELQLALRQEEEEVAAETTPAPEDEKDDEGEQPEDKPADDDDKEDEKEDEKEDDEESSESKEEESSSSSDEPDEDEAADQEPEAEEEAAEEGGEQPTTTSAPGAGAGCAQPVVWKQQAQPTIRVQGGGSGGGPLPSTGRFITVPSVTSQGPPPGSFRYTPTGISGPPNRLPAAPQPAYRPAAITGPSKEFRPAALRAGRGKSC